VACTRALEQRQGVGAAARRLAEDPILFTALTAMHEPLHALLTGATG
jgi:hypothetical protein